ncbi:hypothetical protein [Rheinheimera mangrovi]|uniref:hypothetical protein n=1 Tax=Rheinheimera mangrovi TaxID=2498451 RepID=UPI000F8F4304|nr:hypothetical protein [Rheinheimera mangrovi]
MINPRAFLIVPLAISVLAGCVSNGGPALNETQSVNIPKAAMAPTPDDLKAERKIVMLPFEYAEQHHASIAFTSYTNLEQALMSSGNTIIERDIAAKMREELLVAEKTGKYRTSGLQAADIAVMAKVVKGGYSSSFSERDSWRDDDGKTHVTPASCKFEGNVALHIRVYRLPEMAQIATFEFDGRSSSNTETSNSRCPISDAEVNSLLKNASVVAVREHQYKLLNTLVPPFFVIERRQAPGKKNEALFRTTISNSKGAKAGAKVNFFRRELKINPLTNEQTVEEILITEGTITKDIDSNGSYALVKDEAAINKLQLGDVVKMEHDRCPDGFYWFLGSCHKNLNMF